MPTTSFESTDLPVLAPHTHCVLIARDPNYIYAYWDYTQQDIDHLRNQLQFEAGSSQLILRVYDVTSIRFNGSNANHTWDLDVGFSTKDWYIHVWQDDADYCTELGMRDNEGRFIPLMRSNIVRTPPKTSSKRNDLIWQDIKGHRESQPYLKENIRERYQKLIQHAKGKLAKPKQPRKARVYLLTAQDIRDYYMKLFNWVSRRFKSRGQGNLPSMEDIIKARSRRAGFGIGSGPSWQKVRPVVTCPGLIRRVHQGASIGFLENQGASETLSSSKSGASEGRLKSRKFFFEIWSELIVHGRTEPDAEVRLNDKNASTNEGPHTGHSQLSAIGPFQQGIKLNPDGTFLLRYALPDGRIPLKFIAKSADGVEQRHINTGVEREKTIGFSRMLKDPNG